MNLKISEKNCFRATAAGTITENVIALKTGYDKVKSILEIS